jgi:hypothetical protein
VTYKTRFVTLVLSQTSVCSHGPIKYFAMRLLRSFFSIVARFNFSIHTIEIPFSNNDSPINALLTVIIIMSTLTTTRTIGSLFALGSLGFAVYNIVLSDHVPFDRNSFQTHFLESTKVSLGTSITKVDYDYDLSADKSDYNTEPMQQADQNEVGENDNKEQDALPEWRQESFIWDQVVKRARAMHEECKQIPIHLQKSIEVIKYTNISLLPFGVATDVMEKPQTKDWPVCSLPPEKSCNVTKFSVIFISHTTHRLREMSGRINRLIKGNHQRIQEIILVWNNDRTALEGDKFGQSNPKNDGDTPATDILQLRRGSWK